jgi:hypothetical protein
MAGQQSAPYRTEQPQQALTGQINVLREYEAYWSAQAQKTCCLVLALASLLGSGRTHKSQGEPRANDEEPPSTSTTRCPRRSVRFGPIRGSRCMSTDQSSTQRATAHAERFTTCVTYLCCYLLLWCMLMRSHWMQRHLVMAPSLAKWLWHLVAHGLRLSVFPDRHMCIYRGRADAVTQIYPCSLWPGALLRVHGPLWSDRGCSWM